MAIKDWNNLTREDWNEIIGGILQSEKDFLPRIEQVPMTEEEEIRVQKILEEYRNRKK